MGFNSVETKWNADDEKFIIVMSIEDKLTNAFMNYDYQNIYTFLRVYRLHTAPKFDSKIQDNMKETLEELSKLLKSLVEKKSEDDAKEFYLKAEELFLEISQNLKESGFYYREGKDASHAVLRRN